MLKFFNDCVCGIIADSIRKLRSHNIDVTNSADYVFENYISEDSQLPLKKTSSNPCTTANCLESFYSNY